MKDDLGGRIMKGFVMLRPNIYGYVGDVWLYLTDDGYVDEISKSTKKFIIK